MDSKNERSWEEVWEEWAPHFEYESDLEEREDVYSEIIAEYADNDEKF